MTEPSPYLAAIDQLRVEIAERQQLLAMLERAAGVTTITALPVPGAMKPKAPPAGEPRRVALLKPDQAEAPKSRGKVDPDRVRALYEQGLDDVRIGRELGVSGSGITFWRKKLGLPAIGKGGRKAPPKAGAEFVNSAATIVAWLRQRGTIIADHEASKTWKVNGRDVIDRTGLLTMANRKRELMHLQPFQWEFA